MEENLEGIIYKYTSPSGKVYIGQTTNEEQRRKYFEESFIYSKDVNCFYYTPFYANSKMKWEMIHYNKIEDWKYFIIKKIKCNSYHELREELDYWECYYILHFDSIDNGLNKVFGNFQTNIFNNSKFNNYFSTELVKNIRLCERCMKYINETSYSEEIKNKNSIMYFLCKIYPYIDKIKEIEKNIFKYKKEILYFNKLHPWFKEKGKKRYTNIYLNKIQNFKKERTKVIKDLYNKVLNNNHCLKYEKFPIYRKYIEIISKQTF